MYCLIPQFICVLTFIATITLANKPCASKCQYCSHSGVVCVGKDLKTIPKGIPLTVKKIDLSGNPSLYIPSHYFLQFKNLYILLLNNCGQRGPVYLPESLRQVHLDLNSFTANALTKMFNHKTKLLKEISIATNGLQPSYITRLLMILPREIEHINLSGNNWSQITKKHFAHFTNMKRVEARGCSLKAIEPNSFNNLTKLFKMELEFNDLRYLPDGLFTFNTKLQYLYLDDNKLETFNASNLGLKSLSEIKLGENKIRTFDIRTIKPTNIRLSNNNIQRIDNCLFNDNPNILILALNNNNISYLSLNIFSNIKRLSQLLLHNNKLTKLQIGLFKGMTMNSIVVQNNHISELNGAFHSMVGPPKTLVLTGNKEFRYLNGTELKILPKSSTIFLTCATLRGITNLKDLHAKVKCTPQSDLEIPSLTFRGFSCNGYQCSRTKFPYRYHCRACKRGYHSFCHGTTDIKGKCVKCPPGSFYQDQQASVECKTCRPGQYVPPERSPGIRASDCQTCPMGTSTKTVAGTRACSCLHGYSRQYRFGPCHECKEDGFNCTLDYPTLKDGYWMTWQGTNAPITNNNNIHSLLIHNNKKMRHSNKITCEHVYLAFIENLDITDDTYDRQTMHFNCQMPLPIKCLIRGSCVGGTHSTCSPGYSGALCAVCKRGYYRHFNHCVQCPQSVWAILQFIGYIAMFVILCFIISLTDKIKIEYSQDHRTVADIILSSLKILIGFYQILITIIHAFSNVHWPSNLKKGINIFQYLQFEIIKLPSLRCINPEWKIDAVTEFWIFLITIIAIPFLALLYYLIKSLYIYFKCLTPSDAKTRRYICGRNCTKVIALFLFVTYPLISTTFLQILPISCHPFCTVRQDRVCMQTLSYLRIDYSIPCLTLSDNKLTLIIGYICIAIPLVLPLLLFMLLRVYGPGRQPMRKHKIILQPIIDILDTNEEDNNSSPTHLQISPSNGQFMLGGSTDPILTSALKFSYENYHTHCWYWEVIEIVRKLVMTTSAVLFLGHTKIGLSCTIIISMMFTILHAVIKPLKSNFENAVQLLSLTLVPLNLAIAAVFQSQDKHNQSIIDKERDLFALGILLVAMNSILLIFLIARFIVIIAGKILSRMKKSQ